MKNFENLSDRTLADLMTWIGWHKSQKIFDDIKLDIAVSVISEFMGEQDFEPKDYKNHPAILIDKDGNEMPTCEKCGSLIVDVLGCACGKYKSTIN